MNEVKQRYVEITEEPQTDGYRFRYENEGRYAARIKGVNSTVGNTTYPTIKVMFFAISVTFIHSTFILSFYLYTGCFQIVSITL